MARRLKTKVAGIEYRPSHYFSLVLSVQIYVIRLASGTCFWARKAHQKVGGHMLAAKIGTAEGRPV